MNIVNLLRCLPLFLISFDALSSLGVVTSGGFNSYLCHQVFSVSPGQVVDVAAARANGASKIGQSFDGWKLVSLRGSDLGANFTGRRSIHCVAAVQYGASCHPPSEINPDTGICAEPEVPSCPDGQVYNPVTGECEPDTGEGFCDSPEFDELLFEASENCFAQFPDHHAYVTPSCTDSQNYSFTCNQGAPRGDGGDDGNGGGDNGDGGGDNGNGGGDNGGGDDGSNPDPDDNSGDIVQAINDSSDAITSNQNDILDATQAIKNSLDTTIKDAINNSTNDLEDINQTGFDGVIGSQEQLEQAVNALTAQNSQDASNLQNDLRRVRDSVDGLGGDLTTNACQSFQCTGVEAICYLAKKRWKEECEQEGINTDFSGQGNALKSALSDYSGNATDEKGAYKGIYSESKTSVDTLLNTYTESNGVNFESGCPSPVLYDTGLGTFSIDFTPFCELALYIRALLLTTVSYLIVMLFAKYL